MHRSRLTLLAMCAAVLGCQALPPADAPRFRTQGATDRSEVIVRFRSGDDRAAVEGATPGMSHQRSLLLSHTHLYRVPPGIDAATAAGRLQQHPGVVYAEPNAELHLLGTTDDPALPQLWGHARIQAPQAWDTQVGSPSVLVADVDTGVDYRHPDLAAGQIVLGPDLVNQDADPMDDHGHGTHVAGTIGATGNNALGLAGIAYGTRILAVKVLDASGSGSLATVADGIIRAQQLGARVINLSLGGSFAWTTLQTAVDQATASGTLVVAAAGNDGLKRKSYPAAYPNAIAVGASDSTDQRAFFSNYGDWVDVAAPGVGILSTTGGAYASWSGTSMATPHVTGAAALLLANRPNLSVSQLREALVSQTDPVGGFSTPGLGRLNANKALNSLSAPSPQPSPTPSPTPSPSASSKPGKGK